MSAYSALSFILCIYPHIGLVYDIQCFANLKSLLRVHPGRFISEYHGPCLLETFTPKIMYQHTILQVYKPGIFSVIILLLVFIVLLCNKSIYSDRPYINKQTVNIEELSKLDECTLGHAYWRYLQANVSSSFHFIPCRRSWRYFRHIASIKDQVQVFPPMLKYQCFPSLFYSKCMYLYVRVCIYL